MKKNTGNIDYKFDIFLALVVVISILSLIFGVHSNFHKDKWIDFKKTWTSGNWVAAQFITEYPKKKENVVFNIPPDKLGEFEKQLKIEIYNSPLMENPQWEIYQLKIITDVRIYKTAAFIAEDKILADTWMSKNIKNLIIEYGYKDPNTSE
jgi:hypothetical protein